MTYPNITRPPRPQHIEADVLADAALALGMKRSEILEVWDAEEGRIVTTHDGARTIIVPEDRPDADGQTGVMVYPTEGRPAKHPARMYVPHGTPGPISGGDADLWTAADLDLAASRVMVPAAEAGADKYGAWLHAVPDAMPIRARALWLKTAGVLAATPMQAVRRSQEARRCAEIIRASGWLAESELAKL